MPQRIESSPAADDAAPAPEPATRSESRDAATDATRRTRPERTWIEDGRSRTTAAGGLAFLLNVLQRLEIGDHLAARPELIEADFVARVLTEIAVRCGVDAEDPMRAVFAPRGGDPHAGGLTADPLPPGRPGGGGTLRRMRRDRGDGVEAEVEAWVRAVRRWVRRWAGCGVREVVVRPGRIVVTRTHLDVVFDLGEADPRIRRCGMDLDPGWLPWLGRVVQFHYQPGERLYRA